MFSSLDALDGPVPSPPSLPRGLLILLVAFPSHGPRCMPGPSPPPRSTPLRPRVGYAFRAPDLLYRAMTHASYSRVNGHALAVRPGHRRRPRRPPSTVRASSARPPLRARVPGPVEARLRIPGVVRVAGGTGQRVRGARRLRPAPSARWRRCRRRQQQRCHRGGDLEDASCMCSLVF